MNYEDELHNLKIDVDLFEKYLEGITQNAKEQYENTVNQYQFDLVTIELLELWSSEYAIKKTILNAFKRLVKHD